jgi:protein SCO1/2
LMSVSFDPDFDTPPVLSAYAKQYGADPMDWTFATGALIEIDDLTERFGMYFAREGGGVTFNHNLRTVVIDPNGKVRQIYVGNTWQAEELVVLIKQTAAQKAAVAEVVNGN